MHAERKDSGNESPARSIASVCPEHKPDQRAIWQQQNRKGPSSDYAGSQNGEFKSEHQSQEPLK